jgi:hypothetical protein
LSSLGLGATLALAVAGFGAIAWAASRPHTVVNFAAGTARIAHGRLPPGLAADLSGAMKLSPDATGRLEVRGRGDSLKLRITGLDEGTEQRLRNVVLLRRRELGGK